MKNFLFSYYLLRFTIIILLLFSGKIFAQPAVVTQPHDTAICVESSASFDIIAVNTSAYQWQENDGVGWYNLNAGITYVSGQFTPHLMIIDANLGLNGYKYRCIVSDISNDKDTSDFATLGVYDPPVISQNPTDQTVCKNDIAIFSTEATNGTGYQWQENTGIGWLDLMDDAFYSGTQTPDLSIYTTTGMDDFHYRCIVKHVSCPDTTESATLYVSPTPIIYTVTGGGEYCEGSSGVSVSLDGSEIGISYNLELNDIETGLVMEGTGSPLNFGTISDTGTYTINAYNSFSGCSVSMSGQAVVNKNPLPLDFQVQGGGQMCQGDSGLDVFLLNSEEGVIYDLYHNAQFTGRSLIGTGFMISFGRQTEAGFYTIIASNPETTCTRQMSGSAQLVVNAIPQAYAGPDQTTTQGSVIQLNGNASGGSGDYLFSWQPANLCINPAAQQTATIPMYVSTVFILNITDNQSGCGGNSDSALIFISNTPLNVQALANQSNICSGQGVSLLAVAGGGTGNYTYAWTSSPTGFVSNISNPSVNPTVSTVYIIQLSDGVETVSDSVSVQVSTLPLAFDLTGGGSYCDGINGPGIQLDGSQQGNIYSLFRNQEKLLEKTGTGQLLNFGNYTHNGDYFAIAQDFSSGCSKPQNDTLTIVKWALPIADAGPNVLIVTGQNATLNGSATGGSGNGYQYSWTPVDSIINPSSASASTIVLHKTTLFHLSVSDAHGCQSTPDNAIVFVSGGEISLNIVASLYPKCPGEEVQLFALASGGNGSFTYLWNSNPAGFVSTVFNPLIYPTENTWYKATINDGFSTKSDSIYITVNPAPQSFTVHGGGTVCQGIDPQNIVLQGSEQNVDYELLKNGLPVGLTKSGTAYALDFGIWHDNGSFTVTAQNIYSHCTSNMNGSASITINPLPIANAGPNQTITSGTTATLSGQASQGSGNYTYLWQPSALCQTPLNQNTTTHTLTQTTTLSFTASDMQSGCVSLPDSTTVYTNNGDLFANATAATGRICQGESVTLEAFAGGGTGNYTYSWTSSPARFYSQNQQVSDQPTVNSLYFLDVFDGLNHAYDSVYVQVVAIPVIFNITGGGTYCVGDNAPYIGLSGSETTVQYSLFREPSEAVSVQNGTGQSFQFGHFLETGTYFATAVNTAGCQNRMVGEVNVSVNILPVPDAGQDQSITYNSQALLNGSATGGSGNYVYDWTPIDSLMNAGDATPLTKPLHKTNIFHLEVTDATTGCSGLNDQTIVFVTGGALSLDISYTDNEICPGEETQLFALASGGSGNYTFLWTSNPPGFVSTAYNPVVNPTQTAVYIVVLNDGTFTLSDSVTITVDPLPVAYTLTGGGTVCEGNNPQNILLQNSENGIDYTLLRDSLPTGMTKTGNGYALDFGTWTQNGNYTLTAVNNYSGCSNTMANSVSVSVNPLPVADAGPDVSILSGQTTVLNGNASGGSVSYSYQWQPAYLCLNPLNQNTQTHPIGQSTVFSLTVNDLQSQCLSQPDTVTVFTTTGNLMVNATASRGTVCLSENVLLYALPGGGTGNYSYTWTSIPPGFYSQSRNTQATPQVSTTYIIDVFDGLNHAYDSVYVVVAQNPAIFNMTGGGDYCDGSEGPDIGLSGSQNSVIYTLFRKPDEQLTTYTGNGQAFTFGSFRDEGDYIVTAVNTQTCGSEMNGVATVVKNLLPIPSAGDNQSIMYNNQTVLQGNAQGGSSQYIFQWTPPDSLLNPSDQNPMTFPLHRTNIFNLSVSDAITGCQGLIDQTVVFVSGGLLTLQTQQSVYAVCPGEEAQLFALASGGTGNYSYTWSSNPPGFASAVYNPMVTPNASTTYTVTVNDGNNIVADSLGVVVNPLPTTYQLTGGGTVCAGTNPDDVILNGSQTGVSYQLLINGISADFRKNGSGYSINFGLWNQEGDYTVRATNDTTGCVHNMAGNVSVNFLNLPVANAGPDVSIIENSSTILNGSASGGSGAYSYHWQPGALCLTPDNQSTETQPLHQTSLFTVNVDDLQTGCHSIADSLVVFVTGSNLSVQVGANNTNICQKQNVSLLALAGGGSGTYNYIWTSSPQGFLSNLMNPQATPSTNTTYFVDVFDGINHAYDSIMIEVSQLPQTFAITGGGAICEGENGVDIGLNGSEQNVDYSLFNSPGNYVQQLSGTGQTLDFGLFTQEGTYTVKAENAGCVQAMNGEATVTVNEVPIVNAGNDVTIEYGHQVILDGSATRGSGIYTFHWIPADSLIDPNNEDPLTQTMHRTTLFTAEATDFLTGCQGLPDDVVVFVSGGALTVNIYASVNNICPGESSQLYAMVSGGSGNYQFLWVSEPAGFHSTVYNPVVNPLQTTKYKVLINDGNKIINDSIIIQVRVAPTAFLLSGGGAYCEGGQGLELILNGSENDITYELLSSEGSTGIVVPGNGNPLTFGKQTQQAAYWVFAQNQNNGCSAYMRDTVLITINKNPKAIAGPDQYILSGGTAILSGNANGGSGNYAYHWAPEYLLVDPNIQNPETQALEQTNIFLLTVSDQQTACIGNSDSTTVFITDGPLKVRATTSLSEVCSGEAVQLFALVSGGNGNNTYLWHSNPASFSATIANPVANPEITSWYIVNVEDGDTLVSDSVKITVFPVPHSFLLTGSGNICQGSDGLSIQLSGSETDVQYLLYRNQNQLITTVEGTGNSLTFGTFTQAGTYTAFARNTSSACEKTMNGSAVIVVNSLPIAYAGDDKYIQSGESVTLDGNASAGSGNYAYQWTPVEKLLNPNQQQPTTTNLTSTTLFSLNVSDNLTGCQSNGSDDVAVFITGNTSLTLEILAENKQVCPGKITKITALPSGGNDTYTYLWQSNPEGLLANTQQVEIYPQVPTWYKVVVSSGELVAKDSVLINTYLRPKTFSVEGSGGYCLDEPGIDISLSGSKTGTTYSLYYNNSVTGIQKSGSGAALVFGTFKPPGSYTVTAVNQQGCSLIMQGVAVVEQYSKPQKFQLDGGGNLCANDPSLGILLESSENNVQYELYVNNNPTGVGIEGNGLPLSFTGLTQNGIYSVAATNKTTGCFNAMKGAVSMIIRPVPKIEISGDSTICQGFGTTLTASGGSYFLWNTSPQQTTPSIFINPPQTTIYTVYVSNMQNCSSHADKKVFVNEIPEISLQNTVSDYRLSCLPEDLAYYKFFTKDATLQEGKSNELYYGDLALNSDTVFVKITTDEGCTDTISMFIKFSEPPNAFTPDNNGKNDIFLKGHYITVYNRWGKEIYHGDEGWNGKYDGKLVTPGTYYYIQPIYDNSGKLIKTRKASVTLIVK